MANTRGHDRANQVFHRLERHSTTHRPASQLVASAAFQLGFARMAAGMADWSMEPQGHPEMQARLSNEQFEVLSLAPIDFACRTTKTSVDLCAAAASRLAGSSRSRESDVAALRDDVAAGRVSLGHGQDAWLAATIANPDWKLLVKVRHVVTHRATEAHVVLDGAPTPVTRLVLGGTGYDLTIAHRFVAVAEARFEAYCDAVLADFP